MTLRKLAGPPSICLHPGHNPPSMIVLEPGTYEYTCPGCGAKKVFVVHGILCDESHRAKASDYGAVWRGGRYPCLLSVASTKPRFEGLGIFIRPQVAEIRREPAVPADATRAG